MTADNLLYAPAGSGLRVRFLEAPSRHGDNLMCAAVFEGGPYLAPEKMAARMVPLITAPPFRIHATRIHHGTIYAPWPQRDAMRAALHSLLAPPLQTRRDAALKSQIDQNTLASLIGMGAGVLPHLTLCTRRWRFSSFVLREKFQLLSMTWTATEEDDVLPAKPSIIIRGGINTPAERMRMADRLIQGTGIAAA